MSAPDVPDDATGDGAARELGRQLAEARAAAGKSVQEVADATRIRGSLIRSMEAGDFAPCGGHVYARGHLRSIAGVLHSDAAPLLAAYDGLAGSPPPVPPIAVEAPRNAARGATGLRTLSAARGPGKRPSTWLVAAVGATFVIAVIAGVSLAQSNGNNNSNAAVATAPTSSKAPATAHSSAPVTPRSSPPETVALAGVNVVVKVHGNPSWVHVADESGTLLFQGTVAPGTTKPFHAAQELRFVFGYAPAISLTVNGHDVGQPPLGTGDVSSVKFDASSASGANG